MKNKNRSFGGIYNYNIGYNPWYGGSPYFGSVETYNIHNSLIHKDLLIFINNP